MIGGPRDLSRGRKPFERPADPKEVIGGKSYYEILVWGQGWAVIVHRRGQFPETICCSTLGEVNRVRSRLSDEGLIGINGAAS